MIHVDVSLERPIPLDLMNEAAYWLPFSSEKAIKFFIDPVSRKSVRVWLRDLSDADEVSRKVLMSLQQHVLTQQPDDNHEQASPVVVETIEANRDADQDHDIVESMIAAGMIKPLGLADVVIAEPLVSLTRALDAKFRKLASTLGAREYAYSSILPVEYLESLGYFGSSPQNVMFANHISSDVEAADAFMRETANREGRIPKHHEHFAETRYVLSPAACFHSYLHLRDSTLSDGLVITTVGRCYRHESRNASLLERLWDFSMREIVFVGSADFVRNMRRESMEKIKQVLSELELDGHIEESHDPFFLRGNVTDVEELDPHSKYELRLNLPYKDATLACTSFNAHGTFFAQACNITDSEESYVWTGCTAFGLERWAWACVSQHGINARRWPAALQEMVAR